MGRAGASNGSEVPRVPGPSLSGATCVKVPTPSPGAISPSVVGEMAARGRSMIWLGHDTERGYRNVFRLGRTGTSAPAGFSPMQHGGTCEGSGIMTLERRHARWGLEAGDMPDDLSLTGPHTVPTRFGIGSMTGGCSVMYVRGPAGCMRASEGSALSGARAGGQVVLTSNGRSSGFCVEHVARRCGTGRAVRHSCRCSCPMFASSRSNSSVNVAASDPGPGR